MACDGYTKVWQLAPREVVLLDGARGTTLRVTRGRVWLTQERDPRDIILAAGDVFTVERGGRTVVEAQGDATVCVMAHYVEAVRSAAGRRPFAARMLEWLHAAAPTGLGRRWIPHL